MTIFYFLSLSDLPPVAVKITQQKRMSRGRVSLLSMAVMSNSSRRVCNSLWASARADGDATVRVWRCSAVRYLRFFSGSPG